MQRSNRKFKVGDFVIINNGAASSIYYVAGVVPTATIDKSARIQIRWKDNEPFWISKHSISHATKAEIFFDKKYLTPIEVAKWRIKNDRRKEKR